MEKLGMDRVSVLQNAIAQLKTRIPLAENLRFDRILEGGSNYKFLTGRHYGKHLIIMEHSLRLVEYSPDPRESPYEYKDFNSLDDLFFSLTLLVLKGQPMQPLPKKSMI
jgi:hypothetical protein